MLVELFVLGLANARECRQRIRYDEVTTRTDLMASRRPTAESHMSQPRNGIVKVIVIVVLAVLLGVAFMLMQREQEARAAAQTAMDSVIEVLDNGLTPEEVREKLGRKPHVTREPGKHRFVEEYQWKGPMGQHTVYAYYTTGATKLLEAVSLNQKLEKWEGDSLKARQE